MTSAQMNIKLDFNQVVELVKQLPREQQKRLVGMITNEDEAQIKNRALSEKEEVFLQELDEAVDFVNNYQSEKPSSNSFKQMLDAL